MNTEDGTPMKYTALFDPAAHEGRAEPGRARYLYDHAPDLILAINVALAANRPLLLRGEPGSGKSTLARDIAFCLERQYLEEVVTSRTQAQDLLWRFDAVRRLADVQANPKKKLGGEHDAPYVEPGVLWRAFDPASAAEHGRGARRQAPAGKVERPAGQQSAGNGFVVLLDEVDKADPDVPNDLLVVMDARWFEVPELDHKRIQAPRDLPILLVITTNGERELPVAFVRRCVVHDLETPKRAQLRRIARRHFSPEEVGDAVLDAVLDKLEVLQKEAATPKLRAPSTAEMLDAVRACRDLKLKEPGGKGWDALTDAAMWKHKPRRKEGAS
jgi:MoxR-like ATPase